MNLHAIASPCVAAVNPSLTAQWQKSTGATSNPDFSKTPSYSPAVAVQVQLQALTFKDLIQVSGLNLGGEAKAMYVNGEVEGVVRANQQGGDLFTMPDSSVWLVVHVLENWNMTSGWTKVAVVKQAGS